MKKSHGSSGRHCRFYLLIHLFFVIITLGHGDKHNDNKHIFSKTSIKGSNTPFQKSESNEDEDDRRDRSKVDHRDSSSALNVFLENVLKARNELKWIDQAAQGINFHGVRPTSSLSTPDAEKKEDLRKSLAGFAGPSKESDFGYRPKIRGKRGFDENTNMAWLPQKKKYTSNYKHRKPQRIYLSREPNSKREVDRFDYNDFSRFRDRWKGSSVVLSNDRPTVDGLDDRINVYDDSHVRDERGADSTYRSTSVESAKTGTMSPEQSSSSDERPSFESLKKTIFELKKNLSENGTPAHKGNGENGNRGSRVGEGHVEDTEGKKESHQRGVHERNVLAEKSDAAKDDDYLKENVDTESDWWDDPRSAEDIFDLGKVDESSEETDDEGEDVESDVWREKRARSKSELPAEEPKMFFRSGFGESYHKEKRSDETEDGDRRRSSVKQSVSSNVEDEDAREGKSVDLWSNVKKEGNGGQTSRAENREDRKTSSIRQEHMGKAFEPRSVLYQRAGDTKEPEKPDQREARGKLSEGSVKEEPTEEEGENINVPLHTPGEVGKIKAFSAENEVIRKYEAAKAHSNGDAEAERSPVIMDNYKEMPRRFIGSETTAKSTHNPPRLAADDNTQNRLQVEVYNRTNYTQDRDKSTHDSQQADECNEKGSAVLNTHMIHPDGKNEMKSSKNCAELSCPNLLVLDVFSSEKKIASQKTANPNEVISTVVDIKVEKSRIDSAGSSLRFDNNDQSKDCNAPNAPEEICKETKVENNNEPQSAELNRFEKFDKVMADDKSFVNSEIQNDDDKSKYHEEKRVERIGEGKIEDGQNLYDRKYVKDTGRKLFFAKTSGKDHEDYSYEFPGGVLQYYDYEVHDLQNAPAAREQQAAVQDSNDQEIKNLNERGAENPTCSPVTGVTGVTGVTKKNLNEEAVLQNEALKSKYNRTVPKQEFISDHGEVRNENETATTDRIAAGKANETGHRLTEDRTRNDDNENGMEKGKVWNKENEVSKESEGQSQRNKEEFQDDKSSFKDTENAENEKDKSSDKAELKEDKGWSKDLQGSQEVFVKDNAKVKNEGENEESEEKLKEDKAYDAEKQKHGESVSWSKDNNELVRNEQQPQNEREGVINDIYHNKPAMFTSRRSGPGSSDNQFLARDKEFENDRESRIILIEPLENIFDGHDNLEYDAIGAFLGDLQPIRILDRRRQMEAAGGLYDDYDEQKRSDGSLLREENHDRHNDVRPLYEELKSVNDWPDQEARERPRIRGDRRMYDDADGNSAVNDAGLDLEEGRQAGKRYRRNSRGKKRMNNEAADVDLAARISRKRLHRRDASSYPLNYDRPRKSRFNGRTYLVISSNKSPVFNPGNSSGSNYLALKSTDDMFKGGGEQGNFIEQKSVDQSLLPNITAEQKLTKIVEPKSREEKSLYERKITDESEKNSENEAKLDDKHEELNERNERDVDNMKKMEINSKDLVESFVEGIDSVDDFDGDARVRVGRGLKTIEENSVLIDIFGQTKESDEKHLEPAAQENSRHAKQHLNSTNLLNDPKILDNAKDTRKEKEKVETKNSVSRVEDENIRSSLEHSISMSANGKSDLEKKSNKDEGSSRVKRQAGFHHTIYEDLKPNYNFDNAKNDRYSVNKRSIDQRVSSSNNYENVEDNTSYDPDWEDEDQLTNALRSVNYNINNYNKIARSANTAKNLHPVKNKRGSQKKNKNEKSGVRKSSKRASKKHRNRRRLNSNHPDGKFGGNNADSFLIGPQHLGYNEIIASGKPVHLKSFDDDDFKRPTGGDKKINNDNFDDRVSEYEDDDTKGTKIASLLKPDNMEDESQMELALHGELAGKIVDNVFEQVQKNDALKVALGPGLYRKHRVEDAALTDKTHRHGLDEDEVKQTETMMKQVMELLGRLVLTEVQRRTCSSLPPDLQDFLRSLVAANADENPDEGRVSSDVNGKETVEPHVDDKFLFNAIDQEMSDDLDELYRKVRVLKKLINEYNSLTDQEKTKVQPVHDYLERQVNLLIKYIETKENAAKNQKPQNIGAARGQNKNVVRYEDFNKNSTNKDYNSSKNVFSGLTNVTDLARLRNTTFNFESLHPHAAFRKIRSSGRQPRRNSWKHRKYRKRKRKRPKHRKYKRETKSMEKDGLNKRSIVPEEYYQKDYDWMDLDRTLNFVPLNAGNNLKKRREVKESDDVTGNKGNTKFENDKEQTAKIEKSKRDVISASMKLQPWINPKSDENFVTDFVKKFSNELVQSRNQNQQCNKEGARNGLEGSARSEGPSYLNEGKQDFLPIKGKNRVEDELMLLNKREAWKRENKEELEEVAFGKDMRNKEKEQKEFEKLTEIDKLKNEKSRNSRTKRENEKKETPSTAQYELQKKNLTTTEIPVIIDVTVLHMAPENNSCRNCGESYGNGLSNEDRLKMIEEKINVYQDAKNDTVIQGNKNTWIDEKHRQVLHKNKNVTRNVDSSPFKNTSELASADKKFRKIGAAGDAFLNAEMELKNAKYMEFGRMREEFPGDRDRRLIAVKDPLYSFGRIYLPLDEDGSNIYEPRRSVNRGYLYPVSPYENSLENSPTLYLLPDVPLRYRGRYEYSPYLRYDPFKSQLGEFDWRNVRARGFRDDDTAKDFQAKYPTNERAEIPVKLGDSLTKAENDYQRVYDDDWKKRFHEV